MTLSAIFPPPFIIQRRAWECAYVLNTDYVARLTPTERQISGWIGARKIERLGWDDISAAFRLYRQHVEVRI